MLRFFNLLLTHMFAFDSDFAECASLRSTLYWHSCTLISKLACLKPQHETFLPKYNSFKAVFTVY